MLHYNAFFYITIYKKTFWYKIINVYSDLRPKNFSLKNLCKYEKQVVRKSNWFLIAEAF